MPRSESGFSLLELVIAAAIASILATIAAPSWIAFVQRQQLIQAQEQLYRIIQQTQQQAIAQRTSWRVSFRRAPTAGARAVEWTRYASHTTPSVDAWQTLQTDGPNIDAAASTLRQQSGLYTVEFDHHGNVNGQLGRLTLSQSERQRCVVVATRLGALRKGRGDGQGRCD